MATKKECTVVLLDCGAGLGAVPGRREDALRSISTLAQQKLIYKARDELGLVLCGTMDTSNALNEAAGGYEHITVARDIAPVDMDLIRMLDDVSSTQEQGDLVDAVVVALDMLQKQGPKCTKRLFIVSDASSPISVAGDQLTTILDAAKAQELSIVVIGLGFSHPDESDAAPDISSFDGTLATKQENEALLRAMCEYVGGQVYTPSSAIEGMNAFRARAVQQRPVFQGDLEIGDGVKMDLQGFTYIREQPFPTLKKYSALAAEAKKNLGEGQDADEFEQMKVERQVMLKKMDNPDVDVDPERKVKAYRYGKQYVPLGEAEEKLMALETVRSLKLLMCVKRDQVKRNYLLGATSLFVPRADRGPDNAKAVSAFAQGLHELDQVAIVRYVSAKNRAPQVAVMWPCLKEDTHGLYYCRLPYQDDMRAYTFEPLAKDDVKQSDLDKAEHLINSMNLAFLDPEGNIGYEIRPKMTFNPALHHFYECLKHRAITKSTTLPPLQEAIREYIEPAPLDVPAQKAVNDFTSSFTVTRIVEKDEGRQRWGNYGGKGNNNGGADGDPDDKPAAKMPRLDAKLGGGGMLPTSVGKVSSSTPVEDFKSMCARRDVDMVDAAFSQLQAVVLDLVGNSIRDQKYPKALDCVLVMRQVAIAEEESNVFNTFLQSLRSRFAKGARADFWALIKQADIKPISKDEAEDSTVTQEQAASFFSAGAVPMPSASASVDNAAAESLLDQI